MSDSGSVTYWLDRFHQGDSRAAFELFSRYHKRALGLARRILPEAERREADEEDVASQAFADLFRGASEGRFEHLDDRNDLWQVLATLVSRRSIDQRRRQHRGEVRIQGESAFPEGDSEEGQGIDQVPEPGLSPELMGLATEECGRLLDLLGSEDLRLVAVMRLEGYQQKEIAVELGCADRTVHRKLQVIESIWQQERPR